MPTSSTLILRVKAGDPDAWRRFELLYRPLVLRWCRRFDLQDADAEDVAQEVFRAVAGAIDQFRHDRAGDGLRKWLRTITHNKARDFARRAGRREGGAGGSDALQRLLAVPAPPPDDDPSADAEDRAVLVRRAIELVLAGFKEHTRTAFWRVVVENRDPKDVAGELGVAVHVVYLAKSRVLARLREEFEGLIDFDHDPPDETPG